MQSAEVYLAIPNGVYTHQACNRHYFHVSEVRLVKTNRSPWNSLLIYCRITQLFVGISCFQLLIRITIGRLRDDIYGRTRAGDQHSSRTNFETHPLPHCCKTVGCTSVPGNWACTAKPEKRIPYSETLSELLGVPETTLFPISISMQPCHSIQLPCPYWYDN